METLPDYQDVFILNEDFAIIDVNFQYLKEILLKHLIENYFKLPKTLSQSLSLIFSENVAANLDLSSITLQKEWLELIRLCPEHNKNQLIELYIAKGKNPQDRVKLMISLLSLLPQAIKPDHPVMQHLAFLKKTELENKIVSEEALLQLLRWVPALRNTKKYYLLNRLVTKQGNPEQQLEWLLSQFNRESEVHWKKLLQEKIDISLGLAFPDSGQIIEKMKQSAAAARVFLRAYTQFEYLHCTREELQLYFSVLIEHQPELISPFFNLLVKELPNEEERGDFLRAVLEAHPGALNRLMTQGRSDPDVILAILKAMLLLEPAQWVELFGQLDSDRQNILMLAVEFYPDAVQPMLDLIERLNPEEKFEILSQVNIRGENVLMIAISEHPELLHCLLNVIIPLDMGKKSIILSEGGAEKGNALVRAAENVPEALPRLLDISYSLAPEQSSLILNPLCDFYANRLLKAIEESPADSMACLVKINAMKTEQMIRTLLIAVNTDCLKLMKAINDEPVVMAPVFDAIIQCFSQSEKYEFLSQGNYGQNKLIKAAFKQPAALVPMLMILDTLKTAQKLEIIRQISKIGMNALMMAARYSPSGIMPLLKAIQELDVSQQFEILSQTINENWTALSLALQCSPDSAECILKAVKSLPEPQAHHILEQVTQKGWNLLMIAVRFAPKLVVPLLNSLNPEQKFKMFSQVNDHGWTVLNIANAHQRGLLNLLFENLHAFNPVQIKQILMLDGLFEGIASTGTVNYLPKLMSVLELEDRVEILNQLSHERWGKILPHRYYKKDLRDFDHLLKMLSWLSLNDQRSILIKACNFSGKNKPKIIEHLDLLYEIHDAEPMRLIKYPALFRFLPDSQYDLIQIRELVKASPEAIDFFPRHLKSAALTFKETIHQEELHSDDVKDIICQWLEYYIERQSIRKEGIRQSRLSYVYSFFVASPYQADTKISAATKLMEVLKSGDNEAEIEFSWSEQKALMDGRLYRLWSTNEPLLGDIRGRIMQRPSESMPLLGR